MAFRLKEEVSLLYRLLNTKRASLSQLVIINENNEHLVIIINEDNMNNENYSRYYY